jgi:hypothetical protein
MFAAATFAFTLASIGRALSCCRFSFIPALFAFQHGTLAQRVPMPRRNLNDRDSKWFWCIQGHRITAGFCLPEVLNDEADHA